MSEVEQGGRRDGASSVEASPSGWRRWFTPTGTRPAWGLVRYMTCGLLLGLALCAALPDVRGALLGGLTGLVVAATGSGGPSGLARRVALLTAACSLVLTVVAFATGNRPVWAALAMAVVALLTSLAAAAGPLGAVLGFLGSLAYFLVAGMARVANLFELVSLPWAAAHIAVGCVAGLLVVLVGTHYRRRGETPEVNAARVQVPVAPIWRALVTFDEHARDGVRRAVPLAILMYLFQRDGGRDAFWIFFAAYMILLTPGKPPKSQAAVKVGSTVFGVAALAVVSLAVPDRVLFSLGLVILLIGIGLSPAYPIPGGGLTTIGAIVLAGAPTGDIAGWAGKRVVDVLAGCAIALVATYLFWPRDTENEAPVPAPT